MHMAPRVAAFEKKAEMEARHYRVVFDLSSRPVGIQITLKHLSSIKWTNKNVEFFGLRYPLRKGWKKKLLGLRVSEEELKFLMRPR